MMSTKEKDKGAAPRWMMKNSRGERDSMWTLTLIAFVVTTVAYLTSIVHALQINGAVVTFRPFDGLGYAAVVLVPLLGAYFGRRYTKESNETAVAKAQVYAEVAKRRLDAPNNVETTSADVDLIEPQDEV